MVGLRLPWNPRGLEGASRSPLIMALLLLPLSALADVEPVVRYRQATMKANAGHLAALKAILLEGGEAFLPQAAFHAEAIAKAAPLLPAMFPEGSLSEKSNARPEIWKRWDDFTQRAKELERLSQALLRALDSGDRKAAARALVDLGRNGCGECHRRYRLD